jgi:hypothetical protein
VIVVELLTKSHDASQFHSGNGMLDAYLKNEALQEQRGNLIRVFVAVDTEENPNRIIGYFALKTCGFFIPALTGEDGSVPSDTYLTPG